MESELVILKNACWLSGVVKVVGITSHSNCVNF